MRYLRFLFIGLFIFTVFVLGSASGAEASTPIDIGYRDIRFPSISNKELTSEKPESKLWWNDGHWWASMWSSSGNAYHIFKLDWSTQDWQDTGTALDDRSNSRADALWDGSKLYVVSHIWTGNGGSASAGQRGELYRYNYSGGTYKLDSGFPVEVNSAKSESLVIDKDSTGMLWVTYVRDSKVYVNHSVGGDDTNWATPYVLPVGSSANVTSDDLSSVVAYDGRIGIMWNKGTNEIHFAMHVDGADPTSWTSLGAYTTSGDDHINLKSLSSDSAGKVFAAVKTSNGSALIVLLVCDNGSCTSKDDWKSYTAYTSSDGGGSSPTRPTMLLDTDNRDVYVFARISGNIYYKRSDMDSISFPSGKGDPFIETSTYTRINDPTTTKQTVNSTTGLVVMASDSAAKYYFHNCMRLAGGNSTQCISANPMPEVRFSSANYEISEDGSPTAEVTVELTGSVAGEVTVDYAVTADTATSGVDFTPVANGQLSWSAGSTTPQIISVPILEDTDPESPETIELALSSLTGTGVELGAQNTATLTILDDDTPPVINFGSTVYSVIEDQVTATIDVTLSTSSDSAVEVKYGTINGGTATAGSDYTAISATTMTFAPGETNKSFNVTIVNDGDPETNETVKLDLSNPSANASLGTQSVATLTIFDEDSPLEFTFDSDIYDVIENAGTKTINVMLSRPFGVPVSVYYQTSAGGTATAGSDYTAISPTQLTFEPGQISKPFTVTIVDNDIEETEETVLLSLSSPSAYATLGTPNMASLAISDNEVAPEISFSSPTYEVSENGTIASIEVKLSHAFDTAVSVKYETGTGTASVGSDYQAISATTLTFAPQETSKNFSITIYDDGAPEPSETVQLKLSSPSANALLGVQNTATLTILDDDILPTITLASATYEADENGGSLALTVNLSEASGKTVNVTYKSSNGTAEARTDYEPVTTVLAFAPEETSRKILLNILDDADEEGNETFYLTLSGAENGAIGAPSSATITILDDDSPPSVSFKEVSYTVDENQGFVTITTELSRPVDYEITANYATADGTATADDDYQAKAGKLIFPAFQTSKSFTVNITDDNKNELDETITLRLVDSSTALSSAKATATLTIIDDDRPTVQFKGSNYDAYGAGAAVIEVTLSEPAEQTVAVSYTTSDGTASAGTDYVAKSGMLIFTPGMTSQLITISILKGGSGNIGKTINLSILGPQMADMGGQGTAVVTILKNKVMYLPLVES